VGKQRRMHIVGQASEVAKLIHVDPTAIKIEADGVLIAPEQLDKLLVLTRKKATSTKTKVAA